MQHKEFEVLLGTSDLQDNEYSAVYIVFLVLLLVRLMLGNPSQCAHRRTDQRDRGAQDPFFPYYLGNHSQGNPKLVVGMMHPKAKRCSPP